MFNPSNRELAEILGVSLRRVQHWYRYPDAMPEWAQRIMFLLDEDPSIADKLRAAGRSNPPLD